MSDGANKAFLADPLGFMDANVIVPHSNLQTQAAGRVAVISVDLAPIAGVTCTDAHGNAVPMYYAHGVDSKLLTTSNRFKAYYLPYAPGRTKQTTLGTQARFFFTDKIDGCTFAAGLTGGASPLVMHVNKTNAGMIDQDRIDQKVTARFGGAAYTQLSLTDYMSPEEMQMLNDPTAPACKTHVTVVGIRSGASWTFYFQRRNWLGAAAYRLIDTGPGYTQI
jgi:hypothetical protein